MAFPVTRSKPRLAALCFLFCLSAIAGGHAAENYPAKAIRLIVPFGAGGPRDVQARLIGAHLNKVWGQALIIDNRGGANGIVGTELAARADADGYTLLMISAGFAVNATLYPKLPYDTLRDFAPVALLSSGPGLFVITPGLPYKTLGDLIEAARTRRTELFFASAGTGAPSHLAGELFKLMAHINMTHVPYKGMGPATMDLIAGQLQLVFADMPVLLQQVKGGKLRALAVGTQTRSASLPEVSTMAESGYPQVEAYNWYALYAPAGTPKPIIAKLNAEVAKVMSNPDMKSYTQSSGADAASSTPEELAALHKREYDKWSSVVKAAGIKPD